MDRVTRRELLAGGAALAFAPATLHAQPDGDASARRLLDDIAEERLADQPTAASQLGLDTGARAQLRSRLEDSSAAGQRSIANRMREHLSRLTAINRTRLSPAARTDVEVVEAAFGLALDGFAFPYGDVGIGRYDTGYRNSPYVVIQNVGAFLDTPKLLESTHKVANAADADAYLSRLRAYARQLDGETERLRIDRGQGVVAPAFLIDKVLGQLRTARAGPVDRWIIVTALGGKTKAIGGDWTTRASRIAEAEIAPALDRQIAELERHRAVARGDAGVWKLPRGDAYYAWALRAATTTTMSPDEVHRTGLEELRALDAQMDPILRSLGYTQGTVGARMTALGRDPRFLFPDSDAGRADIIAYMAGRIEAMRTLMPRAFTRLVKGKVEVRRLPLAEEPGAPGAFGGAGSIDGTIPSRVWLNLRDVKDHPRFALATLAYHEGIPGHGWQGEYTLSQPLIRTLLPFNAYSEGWALYAEQIADELGVYRDSPADRLGFLQAQAFRAARLVVDTGLHHYRWTRERARTWFDAATGQSTANEVDRYCAWPGQACGYKIGHSFIHGLREKTRARLGARYDARAFNDVVVTAGGMPLTVLEAVVQRSVVG
jgi:uncharacterized protein (DUF885 family)